MKQIYILEDDPGIRELLQFLLGSEGYDVKAFPTVEEFNKVIANRPPDLALLDIRLPDGDGREVCEKIRKTAATQQIPVILMSANVVPIEENGASDFIPKPFDIEDLVERVRKQLET